MKPKDSFTKIMMEISTFIIRLASENENYAVIIAGARIDESLDRLISRSLHNTPLKNDSLIGPEKPLGTFSAKIEMAYRLGYINNDIKSCLDMIRKIRNSFAHPSDHVSLADKSHASRILELDGYLSGAYIYERMKVNLSTKKLSKEMIILCCASACLIIAIEQVALFIEPITVMHTVDILNNPS